VINTQDNFEVLRVEDNALLDCDAVHKPTFFEVHLISSIGAKNGRVPNETKVVKNRSARFRVATVTQQWFRVTSNLRELNFRLNHNFEFHETDFMQLVWCFLRCYWLPPFATRTALRPLSQHRRSLLHRSATSHGNQSSAVYSLLGCSRVVSLELHRRYRGAYCLHHQDDESQHCVTSQKALNFILAAVSI
jgi:hypothetical protein